MNILKRSLFSVLLEAFVILAALSLFNSSGHITTTTMALPFLQYNTAEDTQEGEELPFRQVQLSSPVITTTSMAQENDTTMKKFTLIAEEKILQVSPNNELHPGGILYKAMTFNWSIPAPVISVNQGDTFQITLKNGDTIVHSLDLHGIEGPSQALSAYVKPGESKTWKVTANNVGVFMYHCNGDNSNGIWEHIASGMYGGIIVHPKSEKPAKEFYMVFGEIYNTADKGIFVAAGNGNSTSPSSFSHSQITNTISTITKGSSPQQQLKQQEIGSFDMSKFIANKPDLILTNGMAYKYMPFIGAETKLMLNEDAEVFKVKPGELTRWYIVNAGPRGYLSFSFEEAMIIDQESSFGNISKKTYMISIPPGSAKVIEAVFPEEGTYVGNDNDMGRFISGAGFVIVADNNSTSHDHPKGTHIPTTNFGVNNKTVIYNDDTITN